MPNYPDIAGNIFLSTYILVVCAVALFFPLANWDMIAYVATVLEQNGHGTEYVHSQAYELVKAQVTPSQFWALTADRPYRIHQYANGEAFNSMLALYRVKLFYLQAANLFSSFFGPVKGLWLLSAVSAAAVGGLVHWWLYKNKSLSFAPLAVAVLILAGFGNISRVTTPDLFSAVFLIFGMLLYLKNYEWAACLSLILACLARIDHLAFVCVLLAVHVSLRTESRALLWAAIGGFAAYVWVTISSGHPGWWPQMWFTHVEYVLTLEGFNPAFSWFVYGKILVQALVRSVTEGVWPALLLFHGFILFLMLRKGFVFTRREGQLMAAIVLTTLVKFFVFPLYEMQFHFAYIVPFSLVLIGAYGRQAEPIFSSDTVQA
ncbi:MAG: hypothetical protein V3V02_05335 [Rhizobiaceae bacterium]